MLDDERLDHAESTTTAHATSRWSCNGRLTFIVAALCISLLLNFLVLIHGIHDAWISSLCHVSRVPDYAVYCK